VKFGRKPKLTPHQRLEALARRAARRGAYRYRQNIRGQPLNDFKAVNVRVSGLQQCK
jgi:hypothetical protein